MRILLIEDEVKTLHILKQGLEENGFKVETAADGKAGLAIALIGKYDLLITDIVLPHVSGIELCGIIRKAGVAAPILMLTALGATENVVRGFETGADDYLVKPFAFAELLARVRALLKRSSNIQPSSILSAGELSMDLTSKKVIRAGKEIELTPKEFALLEYFMLHKNMTLSKHDLAKSVWGIDFDTGTNMVEVYVNYLRKKIDKDFSPKLIHTQFGHGYILKVD